MVVAMTNSLDKTGNWWTHPQGWNGTATGHCVAWKVKCPGSRIFRQFQVLCPHLWLVFFRTVEVFAQLPAKRWFLWLESFEKWTTSVATKRSRPTNSCPSTILKQFIPVSSCQSEFSLTNRKQFHLWPGHAYWKPGQRLLEARSTLYWKFHKKDWFLIGQR